MLISTTLVKDVGMDASAAIGISNRVGSGKVRHIEVNQLWLQEKVGQKSIILNKVGTDENLADALTKGVDAAAILYHCNGIAMELRGDRHRMAPALADDEKSAEMKMNDEG